MTIKTYLLCLFICAFSFLNAQKSQPISVPHLVLKTHPSKMLDLFRPAIPLTIEWNNGDGRSILLRQSYKPPAYTFFITQGKQDYQIYRAEVELRMSYTDGRIELFTGLANYISYETFFKENSFIRLSSSARTNYTYAEGTITRHGTLLTKGVIFHGKKQTQVEIALGTGFHNVGVSYRKITNPIGITRLNAFGRGATHQSSGEHIRPYFRLDIAIGLTVFKQKNKH